MKPNNIWKTTLFTVLIISLLVVVSACGTPLPGIEEATTRPESEDPTPDPDEPAPTGEDIEEISADQVRIAYSEEIDVRPLVNGNTEFAFDLYRTIGEKRDNLIYSPYSISLALAMTYAGAEGDTARQMADTLHFPADPQGLHPAFNALDQQLQSLGEDAPQDFGSPLQLNIANALWGQKNYDFLDSFLELLAANYGAGLKAVDFMSNPDGSRQTINQWVSDQTEGNIQDLIPGGGVTTETRLVLTNAIYFNAGWLKPFVKGETAPADFYTLDNGPVQVPMMSFDKPETMSYFAGKNVQVVELPYVGFQTSMLIIVPDEGAFQAYEQDFSPAQLDEIRANLKTASILLRMPKFEYTTDLNLSQTLGDLGMELPLTRNADFSGMTGGPDLYISNVFHQAFISVDEEGTEASAATAVAMDVTSIGGDPVELSIDRPFIFLIQEKQTGAILFMGRVLNPAP